MRKLNLRFALLFGAASACMFGVASAQTVLKYSNWLPAGHYLRAQAIEPWAEEVARVTQGRVKIEATPKVVGSIQGQFDTLADGLADVGVFVPSYTPGRFEIIELLELPFLSEKATVRSPVTHKTYTNHLVEYNEFKGVQVLSVFTGPPVHIYTAKKSIQSIEDFQGLKLRSPSQTASQMISLLGGTPVAKPATEVYELITGGVLDGAVSTIPDTLSFKLTKIMPKAYVVDGGLSATVIVLAANTKAWNSISKVDQAAILKISGEKFAHQVGLASDGQEKQALDETKQSGGSVVRFSPAVIQAMKQRTLQVEQSIYEKARRRGVKNPEAIITQLRAEIAAGSKP